MKSKNTFRTSEVVFLVVVTCILSFIMSMLIYKGRQTKVQLTNNKNIEKFLEQYNNIIDNYYEKVDPSVLIDNAIRGMIDGLDDPYSIYFSDEEAKNFNIRLNGVFVGLGIEVAKLNNGSIGVLTVYDDSPAAIKGLKVGDMITSINNKDVLEMSTEEFSQIVSDNKEVEITINRNDEIIRLSIPKGTIIIKSASSSVLDNNIGYLKIDVFALNTYSQVVSELNQLEKSDIDSLIIDLRDNTGGHLSIVENVLSLFLSEKHVIYQTKTNNIVEKFYSKGKEDKKYKIVILVNSNSASGAEVLTAALKENIGATVIGKTTFGKGTAQELITLSSGEQYKFTTKEWLTPKGDSINGVGIKPDIELDDENIYIDEAIKLLS